MTKPRVRTPLLALMLSGLLTGCSDGPVGPDEFERAPTLQSAALRAEGGLPEVYGLTAQGLGSAHCRRAEYRQFDFWLGSWDAFGPAGGLGGTNDIRSALNGCLVEERWVGAGGVAGRSMNAYDHTTDSWTQYWMDQSGLHLRLSGSLRDGVMWLEGDRIGRGPAGPVPLIDRVRWTPQDDGTVNQFWDFSADGGTTFPFVVFNGTYVANPDAQPAPRASLGACQGPEYRQADFLLGRWTVTASTGRLLGQAVVRTDMEDCMLEEVYDGGRYASNSFLGWDQRTGLWYRNLVDTQGHRVLVEGHADGTRIELAGEYRGRSVRNVIEASNGRLIQSWQVQKPNGKWRLFGQVVYEPAG